MLLHKLQLIAHAFTQKPVNPTVASHSYHRSGTCVYTNGFMRHMLLHRICHVAHAFTQPQTQKLRDKQA